MCDFISWEDLTPEEREQATNTYRAIRAEEEGCLEAEVDISGVDCCRFERCDGYVDVII